MSKRRKLISEAEYEQILHQREAQLSKQPRRSRQNKAIEPDYDNMDITEFSEHLQTGTQECIDVSIGSGFKAARAFEKGNYVEGTVEAGKAVIGVTLIGMTIAALLGAGRD